MPSVLHILGIELNTIDLTNDEDFLWLNALIWPEHNERRDLFKKAAECVKEKPITLTKGDGVELLPDLTKDISRDYAICLFHTHAANQMSSNQKKKLDEQVKSIGSDREVFHIYNNI